jgi:hypothetical protein
MAHKPLRRQAGDFFQSTRFREQVRRNRNDDQLLGAAHDCMCLPIEIQNDVVVSADDQERRRLHAREILAGQVWPATT